MSNANHVDHSTYNMTSPSVPSTTPSSSHNNTGALQNAVDDPMDLGDHDSTSISPEDHPSPSTSSTMSSQPSRKRKSGPVNDTVISDVDMDLVRKFATRKSGRAQPKNYALDSQNGSDEDDSDAVVNPRKRRRPNPKHNSTATHASVHQSLGDGHIEDGYSDTSRDVHIQRKSRRDQLRQEAIAASPVPGERSSTRNRGKQITYIDSDDLVVDDEDVAEWRYEAENVVGIGLVRGHRSKDGRPLDALSDLPLKEDFEYQIKWDQQAHIHATWHDWDYLKDYRGIKKVKNYYEKTISLLYDVQHGAQEDLDLKEQVVIDHERFLGLLADNLKVERIIESRVVLAEESGEELIEYLVKWLSLPYKECTWEEASLVKDIAQEQLDQFSTRQQQVFPQSKSESSVARRPDHGYIESQPDTFGSDALRLRKFQRWGVSFLTFNWSVHRNSILADEMGLGKTVQSVAMISWLKNQRQQHGPTLVVVPLSTVPNWADTFRDWAPDLNVVVYKDDKESRDIIRQHEMFVDGNPRKTKFHVLLTTYEIILKDPETFRSIHWQNLVVDEAHRLKNPKSQLYTILETFDLPNRLLLTGTPIQNDLGELEALMHFLEPDGDFNTGDIDLMSDQAGERIQQLKKAMEPYMMRRTKNDVETDLKPKVEKILRVELSDYQVEQSQNLHARNYEALSQGGAAFKGKIANMLMQLRKITNHPFMFPEFEEHLTHGSDLSKEDRLRTLIKCSGKMMLLDQLLTKLRKEGHRVLIFSQMVKMLAILSEYMNMRGYRHQRLDGMVNHNNRRKAIQDFNAEGSQDFAFLLSTRAGGLGINLATADTVILFDSDWNPQQDNQAMARAHRIGQKGAVTVYRFVAKDSIDEEILQRARDKLMLEYITIQSASMDSETKKHEKDMAKRTKEPQDVKDIMSILKARGRKMFAQQGNQQKLDEINIENMIEHAEVNETENKAAALSSKGSNDFLSTFANYNNYTDVQLDDEWDNIIPKEKLEQIQKAMREEDEARAQAERENPVKKRKAEDDTGPQRKAKKPRQPVKVESSEEAEDDSQDSDFEADPQRPLNEKEFRNLIRAFEKWCSWEDHEDDIITDAKLVGRDKGVLKDSLQDLLNLAKTKWGAEIDRRDQIKQSTGREPTKKEKETVLFDYKGVKKLNGETLVERPTRMEALKRVLQGYTDKRKFRIPEATKPATYTSQWGDREDGMLCVGLSKHGFGAWHTIRDDPELQLGDKFYLEEHQVARQHERTKAEDNEKKKIRSPGAVHLVRRADYLLEVIEVRDRADPAALKKLENHHRNNRKGAQNGTTVDKHSLLEGPKAARSSGVRKTHKSQAPNGVPASGSKAVPRTGHDQPRKNPYDSLKPGKRRPSGNGHGSPSHQRLSNGHRPARSRTASPVGHTKAAAIAKSIETGTIAGKKDETQPATGSAAIKSFLASLKPACQKYESTFASIKGKHDEESKDVKREAIRSLVAKTGDHIVSEAGSNSKAFQDQCWDYVAQYFPLKVKDGSHVLKIYNQICAKVVANKEEMIKNGESSAQDHKTEDQRADSTGAKAPATRADDEQDDGGGQETTYRNLPASER
ncbi:MAG: hypothetical protein M1828_002753 [Chrysothrix sp. TS-e1954]|nr:MAG: hypothetical protein M1828_002753 [Chrysothrix sp. TS-e1954]